MKPFYFLFVFALCTFTHQLCYAQSKVRTNLYGSPIENDKGERISYSQSEIESIQKVAKPQKVATQQSELQAVNMLKSPINASLSTVYSIMGTSIGRKSMHTLDIDGDGALEIVCSATTSTFGTGNFWYILGYDATTKNWKKEWNSATYDTNIICIEVVDYDKDGTEELLLGMSTGKVLIINGKTKALEAEFSVASTEIQSIVVGDADNDLTNDLVVCTRTATYIVSPTTYVTKHTINQGASDVRVGKLDNSGKNLIVLSTGYVYKLIGNVLTTEWSGFSSSSSNYYYSSDYLELADIDNDSKQEIVLAQSWYNIYVYDVDTKTTKYSIRANLDIHCLLLADVSGDGVEDIIYGDGQWGSLHCYNSVTRAKMWSVNNPESGVAGINYADVNADGSKELIWSAGWTSTGADYMYVYSFAQNKIIWQSKDITGPFYAVANGDVDGDGKEEIVTVSYESDSGYESGVLIIIDAITNQVKWESSGTFFSNTWEGVKTLAISDMDGDGQKDIVVATDNLYDGVIYIVDGKSHTIKSKKLFSSEGYDEFEALAIDDVDGNNYKELYVIDDENLYAVDPQTWTAKWNVAILNSYYSNGKAIKVADVNGDGHKEIIVCAGTIQVVSSVDHSYWRTLENSYSNIDIYDYNKDGHLDIVACTSNGKIEVIDGTTRGKIVSVSPESTVINAVRAIPFNQSVAFVYSANNKVNVYQNASTCFETQLVSTALGYGSSFQVLQSGGNALEILTGTALGVAKVGINCIQVSTNTLYLKAPANSTASFSISYPGAWTLRGDQSWFAVNQISGTGNATITVRALQRLASGSRSGLLTVSTPNGINQYINIIQDANAGFLIVSPLVLTVKASDRSTASFSISSNVNWTVSGGADWAKADLQTGGGAASVVITAAQNYAAVERSCTFTVSSPGMTSKTVTFKQEAAVLSLEVNTPNITVGPEASQLNNFMVYTTVAWTATCDQAWVKLNPSAATGSQMVTLDIAPNITTEQRKAIITIKGAGVPDRMVVVYQNGMLPALDVTPTYINLQAKAVDGAVIKVRSNTNWTATCSSPWVKLNTLSGTNDMDITFNVDENKSLSTRYASISFFNNKGLSAKVTIYQMAGTSYLNLVTNSFTVSKSSCVLNVDVQSNVSWSVLSSQNWITPSFTYWSGNGTLSLTVATNNGSIARAGSVILYGTNLSPQVITVLQDITSAVQVSNNTQAVVYPTVFKKELFVAQAEAGSKLALYNLEGKMVLEYVVDKTVDLVPTDKLPSGIYLVRLYQLSGVVSCRVVKE